MSAQEMFEALGYFLEDNQIDENISYRNCFSGIEMCIHFDVYKKWIEAYVWTRWNTEPFIFDNETQKAVFQQCKELGWIDG